MDNYSVEMIDRTARSQRVVTTDKPFKQSVLLPNIRSKKKMFTPYWFRSLLIALYHEDILSVSIPSEV